MEAQQIFTNPFSVDLEVSKNYIRENMTPSSRRCHVSMEVKRAIPFIEERKMSCFNGGKESNSKYALF